MYEMRHEPEEQRIDSALQQVQSEERPVASLRQRWSEEKLDLFGDFNPQSAPLKSKAFFAGIGLTLLSLSAGMIATVLFI